MARSQWGKSGPPAAARSRRPSRAPVRRGRTRRHRGPDGHLESLVPL